MHFADEVVIDTGTRSLIPAIEGLAEVGFIHAGNWLATARLPAQLAVIPPEGWGWCYRDGVFLDLRDYKTPQDGPVPRFY